MTVNLDRQTVHDAAPKPSSYIIRDQRVPGLELRIATNGVKTWSLRYRARGQRRKFLGRYPYIGLKGARQRATRELELLGLGVDLRFREAFFRGRPKDVTAAGMTALEFKNICTYGSPLTCGYQRSEELSQFRQPIVYGVIAAEGLLYVGYSANGFIRPLSHRHHVISKLTKPYELVCLRYDSIDRARAIEKALISALSPPLNGRRGL
jgi:hypothetical protein